MTGRARAAVLVTDNPAFHTALASVISDAPQDAPRLIEVTGAALPPGAIGACRADLGVILGLIVLERLVAHAAQPDGVVVLVQLPDGSDPETARALQRVLQDDPIFVVPTTTALFTAATVHENVVVTEDNPGEALEADVRRLHDLIAGRRRVTPQRAEYGMHAAYGAALRSGALRGGVGAALVDAQGDVIALGTAEVPKYGGGQYWEGDATDARDLHRGVDPATAARLSATELMLDLLARRGVDLPGSAQEVAPQLLADFDSSQSSFGVGHGGEPAQVFESLGRVVHAEMAALSTAGRNGLRTTSLTMYVTARPCRQCLRHLVGAGLERVVYFGPRLDQAPPFHADSVAVQEAAQNGLRLVPFRGVGPGIYPLMFAPHPSPTTARFGPPSVLPAHWSAGLVGLRDEFVARLERLPASPRRAALLRLVELVSPSAVTLSATSGKSPKENRT